MAENKISIVEFGKKIKEKYPTYNDIDDYELGTKVLAKHPVYREKVMTDDEFINSITGINDILPNQNDKPFYDVQPIVNEQQYTDELLKKDKTPLQKERVNEYAQRTGGIAKRFEFKDPETGQDVYTGVLNKNAAKFQKQNPEAKEVNLSKTPGELYKEEQAKLKQQKEKAISDLYDAEKIFTDKVNILGAEQAKWQAENASSAMPNMPYATPVQKDNRLQYAELALEVVNNAKNLIESKDKAGISGFVDPETWRDNMTLGLEQLVNDFSKLGIASKLKNKEQLTPEEQDLLDAMGIASQAAQYADPSRSYKATKMFAQAIPYLVGMGGTGFIRKGISTGVTKTIESKLPEYLLKKSSAKIIDWGKKRIVELPGAILGSSVQTLTAPTMYSDVANRRLGDVVLNEQGKGEANNIKNFGEAGSKAFLNTFNDVYFEGAGEVIGSLGKNAFKMALPEFAQKVLNKTIGRTNPIAKGAKALQKAIKFNGLPLELAEEELTGIGQSIMVGDQTMQQFFSDESQLDLLAGVATMSGVLKLTEIPGAYKSLFDNRTYTKSKDAFENLNINNETKLQIEEALSLPTYDEQKLALSSIDFNSIDGRNNQAIATDYIVQSLKRQVDIGLAEATEDKINSAFRNKQTGELHIVEDYDDNIWYITDTDATGLNFVVNSVTGEKKTLSDNQIRKTDIVPYQEYRKAKIETVINEANVADQTPTEQILSQPQAKDILTIQGQNYIVDNIHGEEYSLEPVDENGEIDLNKQPLTLNKTQLDEILRADQGRTIGTENANTGSNQTGGENIPGTEVQNPGPNTTTQLPGQQEPSINNKIKDINVGKVKYQAVYNDDGSIIFNHPEELSEAEAEEQLPKLQKKFPKLDFGIALVDETDPLSAAYIVAKPKQSTQPEAIIAPQPEKQVEGEADTPVENIIQPEQQPVGAEQETINKAATDEVAGPVVEKQESINQNINQDNGQNIQGIPEGESMAEKRPKEVNYVDLNNKLIGLTEEYNSIPKNHSKKRSAIYQKINSIASGLGVTIGSEKNKIVLTLPNGQKLRRIGIKQSQEEIDAHKSLSDYDELTQQFVQANINNPQLIVLGNGIDWNGQSKKERESALKNIAEGKKTVAANRLLDSFEKIVKDGGVDVFHNIAMGEKQGRNFMPLDDLVGLFDETSNIQEDNDVNLSDEEFVKAILEVRPDLTADQYAELFNEINTPEDYDTGTETEISGRTEPETQYTDQGSLPVDQQGQEDLSGKEEPEVTGDQTPDNNQLAYIQDKVLAGEQLTPEEQTIWDNEQLAPEGYKYNNEGNLISLTEVIDQKANEASTSPQSELNKQLSEIDGQIEEANKLITSTKKAREKKYAELNSRNGLFGDTKQQDNALFNEGFAPTRENISKALEPFDAEIRVAKEEIDRLVKLRQSTIDNAGKQGEINIFEPSEPYVKDQTKTEAFKKWFGDSKVVDENGKPLVVYHGTGAIITEFDPKFTGKGMDQLGSGFYFTTDKDEAKAYQTAINSLGIEKPGGVNNPNTIEAYLSIKNPLKVKESNLKDVDIDITYKQALSIIKKSPTLYNKDFSPIGNWFDIWSEGIRPNMINEVAKEYTGKSLISLEGDFFKGEETKFREAVKDILGFDGVELDFDNKKHFVAWFPTQIKSATGNIGAFDQNNPSIVLEPTIFANEKGEVNEATQTQINWTEDVSAKRNEAITSDPTQPDLQRERGYSPDIDNRITYVERQLSDIGTISFIGKLTGTAKIESANDVAFLFKNLETAQSENVFAVLIKEDGSYVVQYLSTGGTTSSIVDVKQIIAAAQETGAKSIVMVHNHPSGNLMPSEQDYNTHNKLTEAAKTLGIVVHDSVIIDTDKGQYSTLDTYKNYDVLIKEDVSGEISEPKVLSFNKQKLYVNSSEKTKIRDSKSVAEYLSKQKRGTTNKLHILILDRQNTINKYHLVDETMPLPELQALLLNLVGKHGESVILASNGDLPQSTVRSIKVSLKNIDSSLLDVLVIKQNEDIINNYKSLADEGLLMEPEAIYQKSIPIESEKILKEIGEPENILQTGFILPDGFKVKKAVFGETHEDIAVKAGLSKDDMLSAGVMRITPKGAEIRVKPTDNQIEQLKAHIQAVHDAKSPYDLDIYNDNGEHKHIHISRGQNIDSAIWQMNDHFDNKPVKYESPLAQFVNEPPSDYTNTDNTAKEQPSEITPGQQKRRKMREKFQDSMINVKRMLEGLKVSDQSNIYLADNQKNARAQYQKEFYDKEHWNPITEQLKVFSLKYNKQFHDKDFLKIQKAKDRAIKNINEQLRKGNITNGKANSLIKAEENKYNKAYAEFLKTDIGHYMMAKHAPERNASLLAEKKAAITKKLDDLKLADESGMMTGEELASEEAKLMAQMSELYNTNFDNDKFSGYTTNEANKIVEDFEAGMDKKDIESFWKEIRKANEFVMQKWVDYGKFKEIPETVINRGWQYYVPLRGWQEEYTELEADYVSKNEGEFGGTPETKGRGSLADNPLANMLNLAQSVIAWGEKNLVNQKAVQLARANIDRKDVLHLYKVQYLKTPDKQQLEVIVEDGEVFELLGGYDPKTGMPAKQPLGKLDDLISKGYNLTNKVDRSYKLRKPEEKAKQHLVKAYIKGQKVAVVFANENIANEINKSYVLGQIPFLGAITRVMSQLRTSYNPIFLVKNPIRDLAGGIRNTFIEQGVSRAAQLFMNAMISPVRYATGSKKIRDYFKEFKEFGGRTGTTSLNTIDDFKDDIQKTMRTINHPTAMWLLRSPGKALKLIERLVYFSEISTRFAAYVTARENGESVMQSINKAKEVSVNFDRKGNWSSGIGSVIQFYNATIQAAQKQAHYATNKDTWAKYWVWNGVTTAAFGYLMASLYEMMSGDDDDSKRPSKFDRYNNIVLSVGDAKVSFPMAQGYRAFNAIGHIIYDLEHGRMDEKEATLDIMENLQNAISPVEFTSIVDAENKDIDPKSFAYGVMGNISFAEPFFQYLNNRNYRGQQIYREGYTQTQDKYLPNWERYTRYTNPWITDWAKMMFEKGGGDLKGTTIKADGTEVGSAYDWNPAAIDFMLRSYGGGVGNMTLDILTKAANEISKTKKQYETEETKGFDFSSWPIINSFVRAKIKDYKIDEYKEALKWYDDMNSRYDALNKTQNAEKILGEEVTPSHFSFRAIEERKQQIDNIEKGINKLYQEIEKEENDIIIKDKLNQIGALRKYIYGLRNDIITIYENKSINRGLSENEEIQPEGEGE